MIVYLITLVATVASVEVTSTTKQNELTQNDSANAIVSRLEPNLIRHAPFDLQFRHHWQQFVDGQPQRKACTEFRLRRSSSGVIHEANWESDSDADSDLTRIFEFESLFDGKVQVQMQWEGKPDLVLFPNLELERAYGQRASGVAILTGYSGFHTSKEHDVFEICMSAGWHRNTDLDTTDARCIQSDTDVGHVEILVRDDGRPQSIFIAANEEHLHYGQPLGEQGSKRVEAKFYDFRYGSPTEKNDLGLSGYRCDLTYWSTEGIESKTIQDISIDLLHVDRNFDEPRFLTSIPENTLVSVIDNGNVFFRWRNGWIAKDFSKQMAENLQGFELKSFASQQPSPIFVWGSCILAGVMILTVRRFSTRIEGTQSRKESVDVAE